MNQVCPYITPTYVEAFYEQDYNNKYDIVTKTSIFSDNYVAPYNYGKTMLLPCYFAKYMMSLAYCPYITAKL